MLLVALTGGIGTGKSLAGEYFHSLGAYVIDSDQLARLVVERGTPGFDQIVQRFGDEILSQGDIDRKKLGALVFSDPSARLVLEAITHPLIQLEFTKQITSLPEGSIVINQIPLLVETRARSRFDRIIVITAPLQARKARLLSRGMSAFDIDKRMQSQVSDEERLSVADDVIVNDSDPDNLLRQVEHIWNEKLLPLRNKISKETS